MTNTRGSEWRKWDLHLHTASSYDYKYKGEDPDKKLIETLKSNDISVVAITDHFVIDKDRINNLRQIASEMSYNLVIFPGVELRTDKGGSNIHPIIIFDKDFNLDDLTDDFNYFKRNSAKNKEDNTKIYWDFKDIVKFANERNGIITIHAGSKKNGIDEQISNVLPVKIAIKEEYAETVNILEIGKLEDIEEYKTYRFPKIGIKPFIMGSDNHNPNKYPNEHNLNLFTWIKADTTFEGLKQIVYEPSERTKIQQLKPDDKSGYQVIDSVELKEEAFWDNKILLNENLNVIIGGRSTGKSTLLASIAYKINDKIKFEKDNDRFFIKEHINGITINWKDNSQNNSRDIQFLPQGYMYEIAFDEEKFKTLIADIIKNNEQYTHIEQYIESNNSLKKIISQKLLEVFQNQDDLNNLKTKLNEMGDKKGIENEIEVLKEKSNELSKTKDITQEILDKYQSLLNNLTDSTNKINIINNDIQILKKIIDKDFLSYEYLYTFNDLSENTKNILTNKYIKFSDTIKKQWNDCMNNIIEDQEKIKETLENDIKKIQNDNDFKKGQEYYATNSELKSIQDKMNAENVKLQKYSEIETKYTNVLKRRDNLIKEIVEGHCQYKVNIDTLCNTFHIGHNNITIKVKTQSLNKDLSDFLKDRLNLRSSVGEKYIDDFVEHYGSNNDKLKDILQKTLQKEVICKNNNDPQSVITELLTRSWYSYAFNLDYQNDSFSEMSQGKKAFVILNLLLEFDTRECPILIDQPEDSLDNRAIYKELVEYIKKQKNKRQIIIATHNPNIVVGADAENVIVANQNGNNSKNENNIKFQYTNGSLENTQNRDNSNPFILASQGIREHICDILEGGEDAFEKREKKYGFK